MLVESSVVRRVRQEGDVPPVVMGRYMKRRSIGRNEWRGRRSNNNRRVTKTKAINKMYLSMHHLYEVHEQSHESMATKGKRQQQDR